MTALETGKRENVPPPLIAHVVYRFSVGGLENGVVNLINRMPRDAYRHAIISLTDLSAEFSSRIERQDVEMHALQKPAGHSLKIYPTLFRLFSRLKPAIVHTRNLAALEAVVPAWMAGVPVRIHGEHGRDVHDLDGSSRKYRMLRRLYRPFVSQYIALARDLETYLRDGVGVAARRIEQIYNGVDTARFQPAAVREPIAGGPFQDPDCWIVGTVGRMQTVKHQTNLARAFILACGADTQAARHLRLVMVGDGPLRAEALALLREAGVSDRAWLPGERADIDAVMRGLDCFVLPSLAEGISNTVLEAMACGLPVVATEVGGNGELIEPGRSGTLVPSDDAPALAAAILGYFREPQRARREGAAARLVAERRFSLDAMVARYMKVYDQQLGIDHRIAQARHEASPLRATAARAGERANAIADLHEAQ
jgi:sugar transferase (PEP-CTERM/EpsH1 system associated)